MFFYQVLGKFQRYISTLYRVLLILKQYYKINHPVSCSPLPLYTWFGLVGQGENTKGLGPSTSLSPSVLSPSPPVCSRRLPLSWLLGGLEPVDDGREPLILPVHDDVYLCKLMEAYALLNSLSNTLCIYVSCPSIIGLMRTVQFSSY